MKTAVFWVQNIRLCDRGLGQSASIDLPQMFCPCPNVTYNDLLAAIVSSLYLNKYCFEV